MVCGHHKEPAAAVLETPCVESPNNNKQQHDPPRRWMYGGWHHRKCEPIEVPADEPLKEYRGPPRWLFGGFHQHHHYHGLPDDRHHCHHHGPPHRHHCGMHQQQHDLPPQFYDSHDFYRQFYRHHHCHRRRDFEEQPAADENPFMYKFLYDQYF